MMNFDCEGLAGLRLATKGMPGISGSIKEEPEHFLVEEVPSYEPCGEGEHVYLELRRKLQNTGALADRLASIAGIQPFSVGFAGQKDRYALVTQSFSLHLPGADPQQIASRVEKSLEGVEVLRASRHTNRLRTGHLRGNRFRIFLSQPLEGAYEKAVAKKAFLESSGIPNYYGPQRFGHNGDNIRKGKDVLIGKFRPKGNLRGLFLSAYQSYLFNQVLTARMDAGYFGRVLQGDLAKKVGGGFFHVEQEPREQQRFENREIEITGPMFGTKMTGPRLWQGDLEDALFKEEKLHMAFFKRAKLPGSRRVFRVFPEEFRIDGEGDGLWFSFFLPAGSYATILMREFQCG